MKTTFGGFDKIDKEYIEPEIIKALDCDVDNCSRVRGRYEAISVFRDYIEELLEDRISVKLAGEYVDDVAAKNDVRYRCI